MLIPSGWSLILLCVCRRNIPNIPKPEKLERKVLQFSFGVGLAHGHIFPSFLILSNLYYLLFFPSHLPHSSHSIDPRLLWSYVAFRFHWFCFVYHSCKYFSINSVFVPNHLIQSKLNAYEKYLYLSFSFSFKIIIRKRTKL